MMPSGSCVPRERSSAPRTIAASQDSPMTASLALCRPVLRSVLRSASDLSRSAEALDSAGLRIGFECAPARQFKLDDRFWISSAEAGFPWLVPGVEFRCALGKTCWQRLKNHPFGLVSRRRIPMRSVDR
ncbi:hypothetical protein [Paraburkholderia silvatlantica]|uniref:hypothetical protein n=1 Tax=Paraburkholderia silvatlantica TaxID=321895 RepID=UPI0037537C28